MRLCFAMALMFAFPVGVRGAQTQPGDVVVVVDGAPITRAELDRLMKRRRIPQSAPPSVRKPLIQELIDRRLIQSHLKSRKIKADPQTLEKSLRKFLSDIAKSGNNPRTVLATIGHTEATLKAELALTLAWRKYARAVITNDELKARFNAQRSRYDGTRLRVRQIVFKLPAKANVNAINALKTQLSAIRNEISAGKTSFEDAAKLHSKAPSARKGGDIGEFAFRGRMPVHLTRVAFQLNGNEISAPFVSPFGVHILQVTARKPGQLSLEDVRPLIFDEFVKEQWTATARKLRTAAKIEWKEPFQDKP